MNCSSEYATYTSGFLNFSYIAALLNKKLQKGEARTFGFLTQQEYDTLVTLRDELLSAPVFP